VIPGFELRTWYLLGRHSATVTTPPAHFVLIVFEIGSHFTPAWPALLCSHLCFPCGWMIATRQHAQLFYWLRWGLTHSPFFPPITNPHPPNLCLPSSWDYRHEPHTWHDLVCFISKNSPCTSKRLDGSYWAMSSHHHKCGHIGGLSDSSVHYLFYTFIFVHLSDFWMQFFHFPCACVYINVNDLLVYLESIMVKKIQHLGKDKTPSSNPTAAKTKNLRNKREELFLSSVDSFKPIRCCWEECTDMEWCHFVTVY
jgi:hypothetical protein